MTTPLQSPEYAALVAAKTRLESSYASHQAKENALIFCFMADDMPKALALRDELYALAGEIHALDIAVDAAQAAFDAAYPAPADVVSAIKAVKAAQSALTAARDSFNASLTPEQIALDADIGNAQIALDAAVTTAKALIEAAQVSPSKAFVVRKSVKADVNVQADRAKIIKDVMDDWLPSDLVTIDEAALVKWIEENPDTAPNYGASVTRTETVKASVAFYAAKL